MNLFKYLSRLFDDWVGRISTCLTALLLLTGLFSRYLPSQPLEIVPREVLILLSFVSFGVANYHIWNQANPAAQMNLRITKWEKPHIRNGGIKIEGCDIWFEDSIQISLSCCAQLSNSGPATSAHLVVRDIKPECMPYAESTSDIEVEAFHPRKFQHQSTLEKFPNPCYLRQDEAITVLLEFSVPLELVLVEQECGALANLTKVNGNLVAIQPNQKLTCSSFSVDLGAIHESIESQIAAKIEAFRIVNNRSYLPEPKAVLETLKRYWNGKTS